jgi:hypothetical protein
MHGKSLQDCWAEVADLAGIKGCGEFGGKTGVIWLGHVPVGNGCLLLDFGDGLKGGAHIASGFLCCKGTAENQ